MAKKAAGEAYVVGVDLGLDGGVFVATRAGAHAAHLRMPNKPFNAPAAAPGGSGGRDVDVVKLAALLLTYHRRGRRIELCCLEYTHSFGHESRRSMHSFGRGTGRVHATLELLGVPYALVPPRSWQGAVFARAVADTKKASVEYAHARWPSAGLPRHDGVCDAACLAAYCLDHLLPPRGLF